MLCRTIRRLAGHRPTDSNSVAGSLLARATDPYQILEILAINETSSLTKSFALRRISLNLRLYPMPGFHTDPRYISLQSAIVSHFSHLTIPEALNVVFWLRTMKDIGQTLAKQIPKQDIDTLITRTLALAEEETTLGDRLIHLYFDFVKLGWDANSLLPALYRNMETGNQLYTWEDMRLLSSGFSMTMNSHSEKLVRKMFQRMHGMGFNRGEFVHILNIAKSASEMLTVFNWDTLTQLSAICQEALCLKLERASVYSLSQVIEMYISYPAVLLPMTSRCYPHYCRLMREGDIAMPPNFACKVIVHCGKLAVRKYPVPIDLLELAIKTAPRYINSLSLSLYEELLTALLQLKQPLPLDFLTALTERSRAWPIPGYWTCALVHLFSFVHRDYAHLRPLLSVLISSFHSLSSDQQLLSLASIRSSPEHDSSPFLRKIGSEMEQMILEDINSREYMPYLRSLVNLESKARFSPVKILHPVVSALFQPLENDQLLPFYRYFQFLVMTCGEFPMEVKRLLRTRSYRIVEIPILLRRLHYSVQIENVLTVLQFLAPLMTVGTIVPCLYLGKIRPRSKNADLFRELMMQMKRRWVSDGAFYWHIEEITALIGNESEVWQEFITLVHQELQALSIPPPKLLKIIDAFKFPLDDFNPKAAIALQQYLTGPGMKNPEMVVKLTKGKTTTFDAELVLVSIENTKYEIRDKVIAVTMRQDADLMRTFVGNLKTSLNNFAWNHVADVLHLLTDYPTETYFEGKNALVTHLLEHLNPEIVSISSALTLLSAMADLHSLSDPAFRSLFSYLKSTLWEQTLEEKARFLVCLCRLGYKQDLEIMKNLILELADNESELRSYGHEIVNALHCANCLELESARRLCRTYLNFLFYSGYIPKHDVKEVLLPLIRANITTGDEFQRLFAMAKPGISSLSPLQQCLFKLHLLASGCGSESEPQPQEAAKTNPFTESIPSELLQSLDLKGVKYVLMHYIGQFPVPIYFSELRKGVFVTGSRNFSLCGKEPCGDLQFYKEMGTKVLNDFDVVGSDRINADPGLWIESLLVGNNTR